MTQGKDLKHSLFPWQKGEMLTDVPTIVDADGVYLFAEDGHRFFDMNSGTVCVNIGHAHPKVLKTMQAYSGPHFVPLFNTTESRLKLEKLLAEIAPKSIDRFAFFSEGSVAVEAAVHMAWGYFERKRKKIISVIPCFHGGTTDMLRRSGDPRRALIPDIRDESVIRIKAPFLCKGSVKEQMAESLDELDVALKAHGKEVAAFLIEPVIGSAGAHTHPPEYLKEVQKCLKPYGILLIFDEALCGFGRTGKLFAFEHYGVVPDLLVIGKGLTSGYVPMSAVGVSKELGDFYQTHQLPIGSTYFAHPFCCYVAHAAVSVLLDEDLVSHASKMEYVVRHEMDVLEVKHPSVKEGRIIGLLGAVELQMNCRGKPFPKGHPAVKELISDMRERGVVGSFRPSLFLFCPPLVVSEEELMEAFATIDASLAITDGSMES